jgi:hypothetical protein
MKRVGIITAFVMLVATFTAAVALAVNPGTFDEPTINSANAPQGTHLQEGSISCTVNEDLTIDCSAFELGGVGNTNATALLTGTYTGDVLCTNHGRQRVEAQDTTFESSTGPTTLRSKNGRMDVPELSLDPVPTAETNPCPNNNWTFVVENLQLLSFSYTITFAGFDDPYITIAAP